MRDNKGDLPESVQNILDDIAEVANLMSQRGWAEKNAGNISVNLTDELQAEDTLEYDIGLSSGYSRLKHHVFYVTASGCRMRDLAKNPLKEGMIIKMNATGDAYAYVAGNCKLIPTSELPSHLGIHQLLHERNTGEKVVLHTHATELIVLTQCQAFKSADVINNILWNMHPETVMFVPKGVGFVPYMLPGSQAIADATIQALQKHDIVLWEKHGVFAIGGDVLDTFDSIDIVCKSAKIWQMCHASGFIPEGFTPEQMKALKALFQDIRR